jgi:ABC-type uncharacterized transport system substrate-binding protein
MKHFLFVFLLLPLWGNEGRIALLREPNSVQDRVVAGMSRLLEENYEIRIWTSSELEAKALEEIKSFAPDLILTLGKNHLSYARTQLPEVPRVAGMVLKKRDIMHSDRETGVYLEFDPDVQLDWIRKILPETQVVGMLYSPSENSELVSELQRAVRHRDLELLAIEITSPRDIPNGFR